MGFNMKTWGNPITLDANNLNRIEQGIKNSHDTLEIVSEEVSNLQNRHADIVKELNALTKDAPNIIETLNKVSSLLENNDISAVLSSADNFLMKTQQTLTDAELKQVYKNLELDKFLKLTSIKVNGESVVKGSEVNITLPNIDNSLDINSNNAISNAAVVKALKNINIDVKVPTKLSELKQEVNYQTVTASEKAKWNKLEEDIKNISFTETDPTVPSWAKSPTKPIYDYVEILNTPSIPKDNVELLNGAGYITSPQATTISEDLIKKFNQSTIIPISNKVTALETADVAILKEISNLSPIKHKHTESDITDLQNYALKSDTEHINAELENKAATNHTHTEYALTSHNHDDLYAIQGHTHDEYKTYTDTVIENLIGAAPDTMNTLKELADAITANKNIVDALGNTYVTLATEQQVTGYKKFDNAKFLVSGTDYRNALTSPAATQTAKRYLVGIEAANVKYSNYNTSVYMENGKLYSNGTEVSVSGHTHSYSAVYTGSYATKDSNATLSTLRIGFASSNLYIWNS